MNEWFRVITYNYWNICCKKILQLGFLKREHTNKINLKKYKFIYNLSLSFFAWNLLYIIHHTEVYFRFIYINFYSRILFQREWKFVYDGFCEVTAGAEGVSVLGSSRIMLRSCRYNSHKQKKIINKFKKIVPNIIYHNVFSYYFVIF